MKKRLGKAIIFFFLLMVCCTAASKAASAALTAKVQTAQFRKGSLKTVITGEGIIETAEIFSRFLPEGQKIGKILAEPGTAVEEGQALITMDEAYLQEQIDQAASDLEKLQLQLKQQELAAQPQARTPETASAQLALDQAQQAFSAAKEKYEQAYARAQEFGASPPDADSTPETIFQWNDQMNALNAETEACYQEWEASTNAYNQVVGQYNLALQNEENIQKNQEQEALLDQLAMDSIRIDVESAQKKLEKLQAFMEEGCSVKAWTSGIFLDAGAAEGTVTSGGEQLQIASSALRLCGQIPPAAEGMLQEGDEIEVSFSQTAKPVAVTVSQLVRRQASASGTADRTQEEGEGESSFWYAELPDGNYSWNTSFSYTAEKRSDVFQKTIPLSALRERQGISYVIAVQTAAGILGERDTAVFVPVTILGKDSDTAAVECTLDDMADIIISSNKYVEEGDPVRLT